MQWSSYRLAPAGTPSARRFLPLAASAVFATACAESPTPPNVGVDPGSFAALTSQTPDRDAVAQLARALAMALSHPGLRNQVKNDLRASRVTAEHKIHLGDYLHGQAGGVVLRAMARATGRGNDDVLAMIGALPALELYMPVTAHRESWTGGDLIVAAQLDEREAPIGFRPDGSRLTLSNAEPPTTPVLAVVPAEADFSAPLSAEWRNSRDLGGKAIGTLQPIAASAYGDCNETAFIPCDPEGTPVSVMPWPALVEPLPSRTGLYLRQMRIMDNAEPWVRGSSEIEVHVMGTQADRYFSETNPITGGVELRYLAGGFLMEFSCAGENGAVEDPLRKFDFDGENGDVHSQNVLVAEPRDFTHQETVFGRYGLVLHDRMVTLGPPFAITLWERDSGAHCPSQVERGIQQAWRVQVRFGQRYPRAVRGLRESNTYGDWLWILGIRNSDDHMGTWQLETWDRLETLGSGTVFTSGHVEARFTNNGIHRSLVPTAQ